MLDFASLKASDVLQAMVTGLLKSDSDPLFRVDMGTFGEVKHEICYGCCSTLVLAEMFGKGKLASEIMLGYSNDSGFTDTPLSKVLQADDSGFTDTPLSQVFELESFSTNLKKLERVVNNARLGYVSRLIEFLTGEFNESFDGRWELRTDDWKEQLPIVEATIAEMIKAGY